VTPGSIRHPFISPILLTASLVKHFMATQISRLHDYRIYISWLYTKNLFGTFWAFVFRVCGWFPLSVFFCSGVCPLYNLCKFKFRTWRHSRHFAVAFFTVFLKSCFMELLVAAHFTVRFLCHILQCFIYNVIRSHATTSHCPHKIGAYVGTAFVAHTHIWG